MWNQRRRDGFRFYGSGREKVKYRGTTSVGMVTPYVGSTAPTGWLLCDGSEVAIASYRELAMVLGDKYGAFTNGSGAAGSTHFRLPDLRGRVPVGAGIGEGDGLTGAGAISGGTQLPFERGDKVGVESVLLNANQSGVKGHGHTVTIGTHTHTATGVSHTHPIDYSPNALLTTGGADAPRANGGAAVVANTQTATIGAGIDSATSGMATLAAAGVAAASAHTNMQPFTVTAYIIKA